MRLFPSPKNCIMWGPGVLWNTASITFFHKMPQNLSICLLSLEKKGARKKLLRLAGVPARNKKILAWIKQAFSYHWFFFSVIPSANFMVSPQARHFEKKVRKQHQLLLALLNCKKHRNLWWQDYIEASSMYLCRIFTHNH